MSSPEILSQVIQQLEQTQRFSIPTIRMNGGHNVQIETWRGIKQREVYSTSYPVKLVIGEEYEYHLANGKLVTQICKDRTMLVAPANGLVSGIRLDDIYHLFLLLSDEVSTSDGIEQGRVWTAEKHTGVWGQPDEAVLIRQWPEGVDIPSMVSRTKSDMVISFIDAIKQTSLSLLHVTYD